MIEALRELGIVCGKKDSISENPFLGKDPGLCKVINICIKENGGEYTFNEVRLEDFNNNYSIYLYKKKAAQGANYTPCGLVAGDIEKTIKGRIYGWFNGDKKFIGIEKVLEIDREKITEQIKGIERDKKTNYLLTISINDKHLGEHQEFKEEMFNRCAEKQKGVSTDDGTCSLCSAKGSVFGDIAPLSSYTLDKQCYIAGGFEKIKGWKNFPLCLSCSNYLQQGKETMEKYLKFRLGGVSYYLIPRCVINFQENLPDLMNVYKNYEDKKIDTEKLKKISAEEDDYILPIMQDVNDIFLLTFLFYEKISAKFMIHMVLEDIYPSRLRELFKAKEKAEAHEYLKNVTFSKKSVKDVEFYFGTLREFTKKEFSKSKAPDQYLSLTEKIFKNISIDKGLIMNLLIEKIREAFRGEGYYDLIVLKAQVILNFLMALELIKNTMEVNDLSEFGIKNKLSEKVEKFFKENEGTFYNAQAKSSFLLGVLTKNLLNIQYNERGANPFIKRLKNLTMNERDIKSLYPQIINKLEEYDSNYYQQLEEIISAYLTLSGTNWKISVDEINYYFVLGLTLYKLDIFKLQKEEK